MSLPNPTIVGEFARTKRLPAALTFTRASVATYTDNNGYVQYAANNTARFDHTPADGTSNGLLIEESRTNLLVNTSTIDGNYGWSVMNGCSITTKCAKAPDGTFNATLLSDTNTTAYQYVDQVLTVPNNANTYCFSLYVKQGTSSKTEIITYLLGGTTPLGVGISVTIDWTTKSIDVGNTSAVTYGLTDAGNGWYRIWGTITNNSTGNTSLYFRIVPSTISAVTNTGSSYVWGAQLELGSFPTSYIPSVETFTSRASTATYFDSTDGLLKVTPTNLLTYSQDFANAAWTSLGLKAFSATGSLSNIAIAPDGKQTASKIIEDTANNFHRFSNTTLSLSAGQVATYSIYVKAGERKTVGLVAWVDGTHYVNVDNIDLETGIYTSSAASMAGAFSISIFDAGYGWKRIIVTLVSPVSTTTAGLEVRLWNAGSVSYTGDGISGLYVWGAQVNLGSLQQYTATTATAIGDTSTSTFARPHYNPYSKQNNGILLEPSATNLVSYSEQFDNVFWAKNSSTITANQAVAPDGTSSADKLIFNTGISYTVNNGSGINLTCVGTATAGLYVYSVFAKAAEISSIALRNNWNGVLATFDLLTGIVSGSPDAYCIPYPNGWYRCCYAYNIPNTANNGIALRPYNATGAGDGLAGVYIWGAQIEASVGGQISATSYIPTIASPKTRAADTGSSTAATRLNEVCYMDVGSWYNQIEGTFYSVSQMKNNSASYPRVWAIEGIDYSLDRMHVFYQPGTTVINIEDMVSGVFQTAGINATIASGSSPAVTYGYKTNDIAVSFNGAAPITDTSCALIVSPYRLYIGSSAGGVGSFLNGTIAKLYYFPKRLDNTTLQNLSGL